MIPSVVDVPVDSFYTGQIHVTTKERIFQPSSPFRHAAELIRVLREEHSINGITLDQEILPVFSDGGPDHRITYWSVQVSLLCVAMVLDLDMLIAVRTCAGQSWTNPAERAMSLLNLALQGVALSRERFPDDAQENAMRMLKTMADMRQEAKGSKSFNLPDAVFNSMKSVLELVNRRFEQMNLKGKNVKTHLIVS